MEPNNLKDNPSYKPYRITYYLPQIREDCTLEDLDQEMVLSIGTILVKMKRPFLVVNEDTDITWKIQSGTDFAILVSSYFTCSLIGLSDRSPKTKQNKINFQD